MTSGKFDTWFTTLTGHAPMPWQSRLFTEHFTDGLLPAAISIPTGLGKTAVMAIWLIGLAFQSKDGKPALPRRLVYVVDRRAVVDQSTDFAEKLRKRLASPEATDLRTALGLADGQKLAISTLRGQFVDNREWLEDPSLPAIIVGTVDMIGSRILFEGYGVSRKMRPYHAGLLGADALVVLDEAHLVPPFEALLASIAVEVETYGPRAEEDRPHIPPFRLLPLSATGRTSGAEVFALEERDFSDPDNPGAKLTRKRLGLNDDLSLCGTMKQLIRAKSKDLAKDLAAAAWELSGQGTNSDRILVYCNSRDHAQKVYDDLCKRVAVTIKPEIKKAKNESKDEHAVRVSNEVRRHIELFVGARRVHERQLAAERLKTMGFLAEGQVPADSACFLVATSAGEVGVDLDADHMVCDLVAWERMVQRFGRVNRRGDRTAKIVLITPTSPEPSKEAREAETIAEDMKTPQQNSAIQSHKKKLEEYRERFGPLLEPFESPWLRSDGPICVSPAALRALSSQAVTDRDLGKILADATTPIPLRPALTRPLVDAWSMTSLREHTGRPRIEPWLRGWVSDDPQTAVAWRTHLPLRKASLVTGKEIEVFFEAAPLDARELLETETRRVVEWLGQRVALLAEPAATTADSEAEEPDDRAEETAEVSDVTLDGVEEPDELVFPGDAGDTGATSPVTEPSTARLRPDDIVAMILSPAGDYVRGLSVKDIRFATGSTKNREKAFAKQVKDAADRLEKDLYGATLIVDARIGGLEAGLLDKGAPIASAPTADNSAAWGRDDKGNPLITFRIRKSDDIQAETTTENKWREAFRFDVERNADGDATRQLIVEQWPDAANDEDRRSSGPPQSLAEHQSWTEQAARRIAARLGLDETHTEVLAIAARLHDEGKKAERWQRAFRAPRASGPYAKVNKGINQALLDGYRHEFGSLPYTQNDPAFTNLARDEQDLALHLVAAHHGYARPVIATRGCDDAPSALEERARDVALRFAQLQRRWGPWGLAWWEALLRAADQQASRENDRHDRSTGKEVL